MSLETPKNYAKRSNYASPIGMLQHYNSAKDHNMHEEEFFKIKASRLEAELKEEKEENAILKSKLSDSATTIQILRERVFVLENEADRANRRTNPSFVTDSHFNSAMTSLRGSPSRSSETKYLSSNMEKAQRSAVNSELERLNKENRILKNEHEI